MATPPVDPRIELVQGDITLQQVDAIVNAANNTLLGGGGVDGAIHRAAGPELLDVCRALGGSQTGEARITGGYRLPARWVIHTVGPVWRGGTRGEPELLARCYRSVLELGADPQYSINTIAFPGISTGVYGYPSELATDIALRETSRFLATNLTVELVRFVLFSDRMLEIYRSGLDSISQEK